MIPVQLNIENKKCLCVGAGVVATRRIASLLKYGGKVVVVSPEATDEIRQWANENRLQWIKREFILEDLKDVFLLLAMTPNQNLNNQLSSLAKNKDILINRADKSEECDFTFPSVTEIGDLRFTISTSNSPRLNKLIGQDLAKRYENISAILNVLGGYRLQLKEILPDSKKREKFWRQQLTELDLEHIIQGNWNQVEERIKRAISSIRD